MKKIIIALLAVASVACVQAASMKWSMANGVLSPSPDGSSREGRCSYYTMLVFTESQADAVNAALAAKDLTTLSTLAISSSQAGAAGSFTSTIAGLTGSSATIFGVVFDTYSSTETIKDAGYYYVTDSVTQNTYDPSGSDPATTAVFTSTQMTGKWQDIPEPTSGLLLLLGVAGLALKRKRA